MAQPVARAATLMGYCGETSDPSELSYCWQRVLEVRSNVPVNALE